MKKRFILIIVIFHSISYLAQELNSTVKSGSAKEMSIGFRYGVGSNTLSSNNTRGSDLSSYISPFNFGFIIEGNISDNFAIQPELQFIQKGYSRLGNGSSLDTKFNYLGLNILPKFKIGNENIEASIFTGPSLNANLSATTSSVGPNTSTSNTHGIDFGAIFGVGIASKSESGKLFFDLRYNLGLSDISKESPPSSTDKLNQLGVNIGYIFKLN